nr:hypothetical protein [Saprospiraceae bacterium]
MINSIRNIVIYFNPFAGGGGNHFRVNNLLSTLTGLGYEVSLVETMDSDDPSNQLPAFPRQKTPDCIVVAGGDGTLHQVVNGLFHLPSDRGKNIPITVFPIGSGNDWARAWKMSGRVSRWVSDFQSAKLQYALLIELKGFLGTGNKVYAINSTGIGLTGKIVQGLANRRTTGFIKAGYLMMTIKAFIKYSYPEFRVDVGNEKIPGDILSLNLGVNTTTGGGMKLFPQNQKPGKMGCTVINKVRFWRVPSLLYQLYFGDISKVSSVVNCFKPDALKIEAGNGVEPAEVDGENYSFKSLTAKLSEDKLPVFAPRLH